MPEGENPTRRYKWSRPRQAYRGYASGFSAQNSGLIYLFNASNAQQLLVVRDVRFGRTGGGPIAMQDVSGKAGTLQMTLLPLISDEPAGPAQFWMDDVVQNVVDDYDFFTATNMASYPGWPHEFPIAVIKPGRSLLFGQGQGGNGGFDMTAVVEAIFPDELDFMYDY